MAEKKILEITCPKCNRKYSVELDDAWKAVSSETITKKKLFGTSREAEIVWERMVECPNCQQSLTGRLVTTMPLDKRLK